jgi:hypothetical protein
MFRPCCIVLSLLGDTQAVVQGRGERIKGQVFSTSVDQRHMQFGLPPVCYVSDFIDVG